MDFTFSPFFTVSGHTRNLMVEASFRDIVLMIGRLVMNESYSGCDRSTIVPLSCSFQKYVGTGW